MKHEISHRFVELSTYSNPLLKKMVKNQKAIPTAKFGIRNGACTRANACSSHTLREHLSSSTLLTYAYIPFVTYLVFIEISTLVFMFCMYWEPLDENCLKAKGMLIATYNHRTYHITHQPASFPLHVILTLPLHCRPFSKHSNTDNFSWEDVERAFSS